MSKTDTISAQHILLTDQQVFTLVNALHVAAERYREDYGANPRLSSQFLLQAAAHAQELAALLEGSQVVVS